MTATQANLSGTMLAPIDKVHPAPDNVRRTIGDVKELAASIAALGILEPLIVVDRGDHFEIVAGARRHKAAQEARVTEVPIIVREFTDAQRVEVMLVENLQRNDLTPIEEAEAYKRLVELGVRQSDIGARVGRTQSHVSQRLALLRLPDRARKALDYHAVISENGSQNGGKSRLNVLDARELVKLVDHPARLEKVLDRALNKTATSIPVSTQVDAELREAANLVERAKVEAQLRDKGLVVIDWRPGWPAPGPAALREEGQWYGRYVEVPPEAHHDLTCHAAAVNDRCDIVYVCLEPDTHKPKAKATKPEVDTAAEERAEREHTTQALLHAATERATAIRKILASPPGADEIATMAATALGRGDFLMEDNEVWELFLVMLELEPTDDPVPPGLAARAADNPRATVLAAVLADAESRMGVRPHLSWAAPVVEAHIAFLQQHGYTLTDVERARLEHDRKAHEKADCCDGEEADCCQAEKDGDE